MFCELNWRYEKTLKLCLSLQKWHEHYEPINVLKFSFKLFEHLAVAVLKLFYDSLCNNRIDRPQEM